jgi:hypothetical protein
VAANVGNCALEEGDGGENLGKIGGTWDKKGWDENHENGETYLGKMMQKHLENDGKTMTFYEEKSAKQV